MINNWTCFYNEKEKLRSDRMESNTLGVVRQVFCFVIHIPVISVYWPPTNRDSRGRNVGHIGKVVPFSNESVSLDSNTRSHSYRVCSLLINSTNYLLVARQVLTEAE